MHTAVQQSSSMGCVRGRTSCVEAEYDSPQSALLLELLVQFLYKLSLLISGMSTNHTSTLGRLYTAFLCFLCLECAISLSNFIKHFPNNESKVFELSLSTHE